MKALKLATLVTLMTIFSTGCSSNSQGSSQGNAQGPAKEEASMSSAPNTATEISAPVPAPGKVGSCVCTRMYMPVCGVNKVTYGNSCEADCAGVKYTAGACAAKK